MFQLEGCHQFVSDVECSRSAQRTITSRQLGTGSEPEVGASTTRPFIGSDSAQESVNLIICYSKQVLGHYVRDDQITRSAKLPQIAVAQPAHPTMFSCPDRRRPGERRQGSEPFSRI
jgi:hypothetical protein